MKVEGNEIEDRVMEIVEGAVRKLTPHDLKQIVMSRFGTRRKDAAVIIARLIRDGRLEYVQEFGRTFIDMSLNRPVRLSNRVIVKPPGIGYSPEPDDIVIQMAAGASFGSGKHPTTRLALRGIEQIMETAIHPDNSRRLCMLDIGTGSGILALAALKMGIGRAMGTDTDPIARFETGKNTILNDMTDRFDIREHDDIPHDHPFDLVTANLRFPTLKRIGPDIARMLKPGGAAVFSGIKDSEVSEFIDVYIRLDFKTIDVMKEKSWACVVMILGERDSI